MVSLADPPAWLLLEAPRSTTPGSPAPKATTRILKPQMEELGLAPDLSRLPASVLDFIRHGDGRSAPPARRPTLASAWRCSGPLTASMRSGWS